MPAPCPNADERSDGEHNHEILIDVLGLDKQRYQALTDSGVLIDEPVTPRPSRQQPLSDG